MSNEDNRRLALFLGSNLATTQGGSLAIRIDEQEVLWLEREAGTGKVLVNCRIYSPRGFLDAELMDNVWVHPAKHKAPYFLDDDDPANIRIVKIEGNKEIFGAKVEATGRVVVNNAQLHGKAGTPVIVEEGSIRAAGVTLVGNVISGGNDPFNFGSGGISIG